jgi:hypothetical protein
MIAASIIRAIILQVLMMEAVSTSETSVNFYQTTQRNNSEDSYLHVGFEVLKAVGTKMAVFWIVAPCSLVEVYYPALQPRRQPS